MTRPLVSIVIPAYNAEPFLAETLNALLQDGYPQKEIFVVNDGSTDGTRRIAETFARRERSITLLNQKNAGVSRARNNGIAQAQGKYILPVDADDILLPGFIEWAVDTMEGDIGVRVAVPKAEFFGARNGAWNLQPFSRPLLARKNMIPATALFRREDWVLAGGYCETIQAREDWDIWIAILKNGGEVRTSPRLGLRYRIHSSSKRTADRRMKHLVIDSLNARHPEFFQQQLGGPLHYHRSWSRLLNRLYHWFHSTHLTLASEYAECSDFFRALPAIFASQRGEIIYSRRNELRRLQFRQHQFVAKSFQKPNLLNRIVYGFLRPTKAKRSFDYALLLHQHGIGSPMPIAYLTERFLGLFLGRSYYVSLLSELPYTYNDIIAGTVPPTDEEACLKAIALTTARLHEAGMIHRDYSRGNILFGPDADGQIQVELIDLNRIRFHEVGMEEGCSNFAERLPATEHQRRIMAETYALARGFDPDTCYRLMAQHNRETK